MAGTGRMSLHTCHGWNFWSRAVLYTGSRVTPAILTFLSDRVVPKGHLCGQVQTEQNVPDRMGGRGKD